jgi:hypothetical protein
VISKVYHQLIMIPAISNYSTCIWNILYYILISPHYQAKYFNKNSWDLHFGKNKGNWVVYHFCVSMSLPSAKHKIELVSFILYWIVAKLIWRIKGPEASWGRHCPRRGWWTSSNQRNGWGRGKPETSCFV